MLGWFKWLTGEGLFQWFWRLTRQERKAERLMVRADEALELSEFDEAERIGQKLLGMGYTGGYEVLARSYAENEQLPRAIRVLEYASGIAPQVWGLWHQLGNYYSDAERFQECHACYDRALGCPGVDADLICVQRAVALAREDRFEDALAVLASVTSEDPPLATKVITLRMGCWNDLGRYEESIQSSEQLTSREPDGKHDACTLARAHAEVALAWWKGRGDAEEAREAVRRSINASKAEPLAAQVLRELRGERSDAAKSYTLIVEGVWHSPIEPGDDVRPGFLANYCVVADSPEEALEFVREFEPPEVRDTLTLNSSEIPENAANEWKGVTYAHGGYSFYQEARPGELRGKKRFVIYALPWGAGRAR